jgi:hypothetical protein
MIQFHTPDYLGNVVRIVTETGLRVYRELTLMEKGSKWISKTRLFGCRTRRLRMEWEKFR